MDPTLTIAPTLAAVQDRPGFILQAEKHTSEVDPKHPIPVFFRQVGNSAEPAFDAGIVDGVVEAAERLNRVGDHVLHILGRGDIRLDGRCLPSSSLDLGHQRREVIFPPRGHHDARALRCEGLGRCPSDPTARSGNQCDSTVHVRHAISLPRV